jgi:hypothetical protein
LWNSHDYGRLLLEQGVRQVSIHNNHHNFSQLLCLV